jgi:prepilin-type N-terminal cleavage/methylation domain-containing protein
MQHKQIPRASGFTLVELLVVISIIALLIAITVPVVGRATESARRAQAQTEVASLETAIRAYYNEYSRFPHQGALKDAYIDSNSDLINVLRARDSQDGNVGHANNRRRIVFLEVSDRSLSEGANPNYIDPWRRPYRAIVDVRFQGFVRPPDHDELEGRIVATWSLGAEPENVQRHLTSWK